MSSLPACWAPSWLTFSASTDLHPPLPSKSHQAVVYWKRFHSHLLARSTRSTPARRSTDLLKPGDLAVDCAVLECRFLSSTRSHSRAEPPPKLSAPTTPSATGEAGRRRQRQNSPIHSPFVCSRRQLKAMSNWLNSVEVCELPKGYRGSDGVERRAGRLIRPAAGRPRPRRTPPQGREVSELEARTLRRSWTSSWGMQRMRRRAKAGSGAWRHGGRADLVICACNTTSDSTLSFLQRGGDTPWYLHRGESQIINAERYRRAAGMVDRRGMASRGCP